MAKPREIIGERYSKVSTLDTVVLLMHLFHAQSHPRIGFEDADKTFLQICHQLNKRFWITTEALESALWACNLLDEQGAFMHPMGSTFDQFVAKLCAGTPYKFNKEHHFFERKSY